LSHPVDIKIIVCDVFFSSLQGSFEDDALQGEGVYAYEDGSYMSKSVIYNYLLFNPLSAKKSKLKVTLYQRLRRPL